MSGSPLTPVPEPPREAQQRIADLLPAVRLVAVLRDPVERAHSNWSHLRGAGLEPEADFLTACRAEPERREQGWAHFWHYTAQGRYGEQLDHLGVATGVIEGIPRHHVRPDVSGRTSGPTDAERAALLPAFPTSRPTPAGTSPPGCAEPQVTSSSRRAATSRTTGRRRGRLTPGVRWWRGGHGPGARCRRNGA